MPHYAVLDCETTLLEHGKRPNTLFWGLATETGGYRRFESTKHLSIFLHSEHKSDPLHILHHSNFDVIQLLLDGVQSLNILRSHNGKLILSKWGEHLLMNSHAMFPVGLATLFSAFGHKKTPLADLEKRNYDDCVLALDIFLRMDDIFQELVNESPLSRHTVAATSFHAAERFAGKMPKDLRFVEAYRGGRCEVFNTGEWCANKFDINSSYSRSFMEAPEIGQLMLIEVDSDCWHGPFADIDEADRLLFPAGKFRTWIYQDVFERYIEPHWRGSFVIREKHTIDLSWLKRVAQLIDKLYKLKCESDGGLREVCKFLLNSMYGRIGLKGVTERCRILPYIPDGDDITACQLGDYGKFIVWDKRQIVPRSNYPMAAYITDNARGRLYSEIKRTDPIYTDTDSLFIRSPMFRGGIDPGLFPSDEGKGLGQWKYEGTDIFRANNLKDYFWSGERMLKGGERNMQWTLKRMAKGQGADLVEKEFSLELRKRILRSDGTTEPIRKG